MMAPMSVASSSGSPSFSAWVFVVQLVEEAVEDVGVQEQARAGGAGLALAGEAHAGDDAVHHPVLVGVGIDDRRALAAQFQRYRHDAFGRGTHDDLADLGRSGERQFADRRMLRQRGRRIPRRGRSARSARPAAGIPGRLRPSAARRAARPRRPSSPGCCRRTARGRSSARPSRTGAFHGMMAPTTPSGSRRV